MQVEKINDKVNTSDYIWFLLLTPLLKTNGLVEHYSVLSRVNNVLTLFVLIILIYAFVKLKRKSNPTILVLIVACFSYIFLRTLLLNKDADYRGLIISITYCVALALYVYILSNKPIVLIKALLINLEVNIYINLATLIAFPDGIYMTGSGDGKCWFLGYDNWWYIVFYTAYLIAVLHYKYTGKVARTVILLVVMHISAFLRMSGVIVLGLLMMDAFLLTKVYKTRIFNYKNICIATVVANILLIFLYSSGLVAFFVKLSGRPINTLFVRNRIWNITIQEISQNLLLGCGRSSAIYRTALYGLKAGVNAHNMWLEILYEGGIIAAVFFILILIVVGIGLNRAADSDIKQLLILCIFTCFIGLSVDSVLFELRGNLFYALLTLAANLYMVDNVSAISSENYRIKRNIKIRLKI